MIQFKPLNIFRKSSEENISRISGGVFSGTLSKNQKADFITVSINTPRMQPLHDVINNIVMCASSKEVKDVYIEGECIVKDSKFQNIDEEIILEEGTNAINTLFTKTGFDKKILDASTRIKFFPNFFLKIDTTSLDSLNLRSP